MCAETLLREIIPEFSCKPNQGGPTIYLSMLPHLHEVCWQAGRLEALLKMILEYIRSASHPTQNIRVAVRQRKKLPDMEQFFGISPSYWFQLSIKCQSLSGLEAGTQQALESFGYRCDEWVGVEGSKSALGAFRLDTQDSPALILYFENHGARRNCDILIPITESDSCQGHAV